MTQFTCKGVKQINNRISFKHLYHSYFSAFFISAGVPNGIGQPLMPGKLLISIKRAMNLSRIELLWLVWDLSRSKYYLRTKFQDGIDKPQNCQNVCYHLMHNWRFFIDVFDACFYCLLMFSFCLFQY
jgi:hypothetical protein